jgi:hypothetical protein
MSFPAACERAFCWGKMARMRIVLFTPYSPELGGGSVQFRSHMRYLSDFDIEWRYLSNIPVQGDEKHWLGSPFTTSQLTADFSKRSGFLPGSTERAKEIANRLDAGLYWVVAHYEGISVADELLSRGKPVHLTVHDEPLAMLVRSRRFRPLWPLMSMIFPRVLRGARSVDVTSTMMRDHFKLKYGVSCFALYKYLPELPEIAFRLSDKILRVGHIGSLYHPDPFRKFILACRTYAATQNISLKIERIGISPEMDQIALENETIFENHGELLEDDALPVLATCNFVYAMYPEGFRFQGFRRTSLPIKISTYIQAQRPIFAHTPADSGLAQLVEKEHVGHVCTRYHPDDIRTCVAKLLEMKISRENFEAARKELMGREQIEQLRKALHG